MEPDDAVTCEDEGFGGLVELDCGLADYGGVEVFEVVFVLALVRMVVVVDKVA